MWNQPMYYSRRHTPPPVVVVAENTYESTNSNACVEVCPVKVNQYILLKGIWYSHTQPSVPILNSLITSNWHTE